MHWYNPLIMRRLMLGSAGLLSLVSIGLTCAMWARSDGVMDWVRVSALDRSAVVASSRAHVGAAIVVEDHWITSRQRAVRYRNFQPTDLRAKFPEQILGFGYRVDDGVYFVLCPMWALVLGATLPPIVWVQQKHARRMRRKERRAEQQRLASSEVMPAFA
jgi:hypothetical protein